jgi:DNA-binding HxlR family transcriptional regulator
VPTGGTDFDREPEAWFGRRDDERGEGQGPVDREDLYQLLGSRWVVSVLRELRDGTVRYNALHRRLDGVSHKMLTQTLRRLERAQLVHRRAHRTVPPNVDYQLTVAGVELLDLLTRLEQWATAHGLLSSPQGRGHRHSQRAGR